MTVKPDGSEGDWYETRKPLPFQHTTSDPAHVLPFL